MEGTWIEFAKRMSEKNNVKIARVDCTQNERVCASQNVLAYPTLVLYKDGSKLSDYLDPRDLESLEDFINRHTHDEL
jgi:thioredoxin-like negative regulator of GroEL